LLAREVVVGDWEVRECLVKFLPGAIRFFALARAAQLANRFQPLLRIGAQIGALRGFVRGGSRLAAERRAGDRGARTGSASRASRASAAGDRNRFDIVVGRIYLRRRWLRAASPGS